MSKLFEFNVNFIGYIHQIYFPAHPFSYTLLSFRDNNRLFLSWKVTRRAYCHRKSLPPYLRPQSATIIQSEDINLMRKKNPRSDRDSNPRSNAYQPSALHHLTTEPDCYAQYKPATFVSKIMSRNNPATFFTQKNLSPETFLLSVLSPAKIAIQKSPVSSRLCNYDLKFLDKKNSLVTFKSESDKRDY